MCREWLEHFVHEHDVLEIVDNTLAVEEVHGRRQPIPVQGLCEPQPASATRHVGYRDDFLEGYDLYCCDDGYDVNMPHAHGQEEAGHHDKRPYRPGNEGLLLLLVLRSLRFFQLDILVSLRPQATPRNSNILTSFATSLVVFCSDAGSEPPSLMSEKLLLRAPSNAVALPFLWLNLIFRRGFAMLSVPALSGAVIRDSRGCWDLQGRLSQCVLGQLDSR